MFTFFTVCKPFTGLTGIIQRNAIASWLSSAPGAQILLVGDEAGTAEAANAFGVEHEPQLERTLHGAPLLDDVFRRVYARARHSVLAFVNADIIFTGDFGGLAHVRSPFVVVGEAVDLPVTAALSFDRPDWRSSLPAGGTSRGPLALDYFFFSRGMFDDIPPFALGRARFDNWLVWKALREGAAVVDGTDVLRAVHQRHDYGHLANGRREAYGGADARRNQSLAGWRCYVHLFSVLDARWRLTSGGLVPRRRQLVFVRQLVVRVSGLMSRTHTSLQATGAEPMGADSSMTATD